jgi:RNase H-like domain found in reverse transcriptase
MHIWIKNYSTIAHPLVNLTQKGEAFAWDDKHTTTMQSLKNTIIGSPTLISINYTSECPVYLAVDSSIHGVGWILSQKCLDGACCPAYFGSILWNECKSHYSQAKLELYDLFHTLRALCLYLVGVCNLVVEMDAAFIRGMLNNPDCQPNTMINRWITAIHLFDFKLMHVPMQKHHGPDGLSRRMPAEGEEAKENDPEKWIDNMLSLGVWASTWLDSLTLQLSNPLPSNLVLSTEALDNSTPTTFPVNSQLSKSEDDISQIQDYLTTLKLPSNLSDAPLAKFLHKTKHFSLIDG